MPFNTHYLDELSYLREQGRLYARANPEMVQFLGEAGTDPDVERLLEGFAFLTARLHQRLDGQLPEICHDLIEALWPQFLQPLPALTTVQFTSRRAGEREPREIPRGTDLDSVPVDGTRCRFRTVFPVTMLPLRLSEVSLRQDGGGSLRLELELAEGLDAETFPWSTLRLYLGAAPAAANLMLCLQRWCVGCSIGDGQRHIELPPDALRPVGYGAEDGLAETPIGAFAGLRLLHEHFAAPDKFRFIDVAGLEVARGLGQARRLTLTFRFSQLPSGMPMIGSGAVQLHCTPAINLFAHEADPITVDGRRSQYRIRPTGEDEAHFEIHEVLSVVGLRRGAGKPVTYRPLHRGTDRGTEAGPSYLLRRRPSLIGSGNDCLLELLQPDGSPVDGEEVVSVSLRCSNRRLPLALAPGDLATPSVTTPTGVEFRNLSRPTASVTPELGGVLEWRLIAHLAQNLRALASVEGLRALIDLIDLRATVDQQAQQARRRMLEAIEAVKTVPVTRIVDGAPVRGVGIELQFDESGFESPGDLHLLGEVLDRVFADCAPLNAFAQLTVIGSGGGDRHVRAPRLGARRLL